MSIVLKAICYLSPHSQPSWNVICKALKGLTGNLHVFLKIQYIYCWLMHAELSCNIDFWIYIREMPILFTLPKPLGFAVEKDLWLAKQMILAIAVMVRWICVCMYLCTYYKCVWRMEIVATFKWWILVCMSFPSGSVGRESTCNVGDMGSIPGWGRSPGGGHGNSLQYSCLEILMDRGAR